MLFIKLKSRIEKYAYLVWRSYLVYNRSQLYRRRNRISCIVSIMISSWEENWLIRVTCDLNSIQHWRKPFGLCLILYCCCFFTADESVLNWRSFLDLRWWHDITVIPFFIRRAVPELLCRLVLSLLTPFSHPVSPLFFISYLISFIRIQSTNPELFSLSFFSECSKE